MNRKPFSLRWSAVALAGAAVLSASSHAPAQELVSPTARAQRVAEPGRSVAGSDDSSALVINPANLAFMPGAELRWNWVRTGEDALTAARGHAVALASTLPFGLASGIRFDVLRPAGGAPQPYDAPYSWFTWGLAYGNESSALGLSIAHVYSNDPKVGGPTPVSLGWTARPFQHLSVSAVAHDLNAPVTATGARVDRSYSVGMAMRPTGTNVLEIGVEGRYFEDADKWLLKGVLGVRVPYVGRLRGDIAARAPLNSKTEYVASAMLDLTFPHVVLTGGGIFGTALGGQGGAGFVSGVALQSWRDPGVPAPAHAVRIRIGDTPGNRQHVHLLQKLWKMSGDSEIDAVVLQLKTEPASSMAHASELADAVQMLRAKGKKVICAMEAEGGRALYVCSYADRIVLNPAGGVRFSGMKMQHTYLASMMNKLGVRAEFVRIGAFKSAPEQFTRDGASPAALQEYEQNLREIENEYVTDISRARHMDPAALRASFVQGPFTATEALRYRLVDGYAYDDELRRVVYEVLGGKNVALTDDYEPEEHRTFGESPGIAIVYLDGDMIDGDSRKVPLLGMRLAGSYTIAKALRNAREDPSVRAVIFRIESPGGSSMAADVIWREAELTARQKPLIVSMGTVAASGGYYAAAPGKLIFANPYTTTGSIGIFYGKADIAELLTKVGVNVETIRTAPHADAESIYRAFTEEERKLLGEKVKQFYDVFVDRVARGRKLSPAQVDAVARGRVWMGRQALANKLIDRLGGLRDALAEARLQTGLAEDCPVVELPPAANGILDVVANAIGVRSGSDELRAAVPPQVVSLLQPLAPFLIYDPDRPLALLEVADLP
jgi:protease IV